MSASAVEVSAAYGLAWTPEDDAILRECYVRDGAKATAERLGRTLVATFDRARRLRVLSHRRWTEVEDRRLAMLWAELPLRELAKRFGRTEMAVHQHGRVDLGLKAGLQQGMESLQEAANRTGFDRKALTGILRWAHVGIGKTMSRPVPGAGYRYTQLDPVDVDEAVEKWLACETVNAAAERHGMLGETLATWIEESGIPAPPRPPRKYRWRVPSDIVDRVVAERRQTESVNQAAARTGISRDTLAKWLRAGGVAKAGGHRWRVKREDVDRLVANLTDRQRSYLRRGQKAVNAERIG